MSGVLIRDYSGATSVHMHNGLPYDVDGALLVSQGYCIGQNYTGWRRDSNGTTDQTPQTLTQVTLPGSTMNRHGKLVIEQDWEWFSSANIKVLAVEFAGWGIQSAWANTTGGSDYRLSIKNAGSLTSQIFTWTTQFGAGARGTTPVDTASDVAIGFKVSWKDGNFPGEYAKLLGYSIWYYPGNS